MARAALDLPPPNISPPAPILTWTSLDRWAAENTIAPPRKLATNHHVVHLACTEQLYRIFERC